MGLSARGRPISAKCLGVEVQTLWKAGITYMIGEHWSCNEGEMGKETYQNGNTDGRYLQAMWSFATREKDRPSGYLCQHVLRWVRSPLNSWWESSRLLSFAHSTRAGTTPGTTADGNTR